MLREIYAGNHASAVEAATELAETWDYTDLNELIEVLYPDGELSSEAFDVCCEAIERKK